MKQRRERTQFSNVLRQRMPEWAEQRKPRIAPGEGATQSDSGETVVWPGDVRSVTRILCDRLANHGKIPGLSVRIRTAIAATSRQAMQACVLARRSAWPIG